MYKKLFKNKAIMSLIIFTIMAFISINTAFANTVDSGVIDSDNSSGGLGSNYASCIYYPINGNKDVKLNLVYLEGSENTLKDPILTAPDLSESEKVFSYRTTGTAPADVYKYVDIVYSLKTDSEYNNFYQNNFKSEQGLTCPTVFFQMSEPKTKIHVTGNLQRDGEVYDYVEIEFTTVSSSSFPVYMDADSEESKIVSSDNIPKTCIFDVDNYFLRREDQTYNKSGTEEIQFSDNIPGFSSSNIIAKSVSGLPVDVSDKVNLTDIFSSDATNYCVGNIKGYCVDGEGCYILATSETSDLAGDVEIDKYKNATAADLVDYRNSLKIDFRQGFSTCNDISAILDFTNEMYGLIIVFVVIGLILLTMMDFLKAVSSGKDDANKKAFKAFQTRLMIGVIIILLPVLLRFTFDIFGVASEEEYVTCIPRT